MYDVRLCCEVFQVSASGFYAWLKRPLSKRKTEDERIWQKIKRHWRDSRKTYGRRRVRRSLKNEGEGIGKKKFKPQTTTSNHELPVAENLVTHTDLYSQYAAQDYADKLAEYEITASMSRKGNCYDNAFLESFFRTLKVELVHTAA